MMYASNEELLREGECPKPNCIEEAGHVGPCSWEQDTRKEGVDTEQLDTLDLDNTTNEQVERSR